MMGQRHALSGAAVSMAASAAAPLAALISPSVGMSVFVAAVTGGAAVLPDIDHPDSTIARTFGPATWVLSKVVAALSGGHRNGTHSATGCSMLALAAFGAYALHTGRLDGAMGGLLFGGVLMGTALLTFMAVGRNGQTCYKTRWGGPAVVGVLTLATLAVLAAALAFGAVVGSVILGLLILLALSALARVAKIPGGWDEAAAVGLAYWAVAPEAVRPEWLPAPPDLALVPWALAVGVVVHCAGDAITHGGIPWAWPLSQVNCGPKLIATNGPTERRVLGPLFVIVIAASLGWMTSWAVGAVCLVGLWWLVKQGAPPKKRKPSASGRKPAARRPAARKRPSRTR